MGKSFIKDFSWYFVGSFLPILIGIIRTPIFTRHFNSTDYGVLGLVVVTFSFFGMFLFSWINSCIWRYYSKYFKLKKLKIFYSNLFFLMLIAVIVLTIISGIWYYFELNELVKTLILYSFLHLVFNQLYLYYIVVVRLEGKAKFYTFFQSFRALFSLVLVLILVFVYNVDISALILSLLIIDFLSVLYLVFLNPSKVFLDLSLVRKKYLRELLVYGSAGLLLNICFLTISSSDRYIIAWLGDFNEVGIYDQAYKLSQLSIMALVTVFFNTITPTLIHELETNYSNSKYLIREYLKLIIIVGFPIVFYISFFSKEIAFLLLGEDFRVGYIIMPYVFFAAFIHGILNFYELRLKFTNKLKRLSFIVVFGTLINIFFTILFVWLYDYFWAAYTTVFTYVVLLILFHLFDKELVKIFSREFKYLVQLLLVAFVQFIIYITLNSIIGLTFINKIILISLFMLSYIYFLKDSIKTIKTPLKI